VLAVLFGETEGARVAALLDKSESRITSELTLVECDRAIHRATRQSVLSEAKAADLRHDLTAMSKDWNVLRLTPTIIARARQPFPVEPIRTLDALHIASALEGRSLISGLALLSLDARVRRAAVDLGFRIAPE
jgi:predicted nucleic acid-binding protein